MSLHLSAMPGEGRLGGHADCQVKVVPEESTRVDVDIERSFGLLVSSFLRYLVECTE